MNSATNQLSSVAYDAAGNQQSDGISHTFTYDAEGNITAVDNGSTATYVYDALNHRVRTVSSAGSYEYLFDAQGRRTSMWQTSNNFGVEGRIYWGRRQIAFRNGPTYYEHQNDLGTERLRTSYTGAVAATEFSLAYGDDFSQTVTISGSDQDNKQYAGQQYDIESDSQHAQFRQYSSTQGRWMSPDPYDASYDPDNPQSFNRYSYVLDNPLMGKDASGLECESDDTSTTDESDQAGGRNSPGRDDNSGGDPYTATVVGCPAGTDDLLCSNPAPDPAPVCPDCYITPEPPSYGPAQGGGGSSGAAAAPNNATQNKQLKCAGEALKKNGVALALDAASLGVDAFGPEAQYAKLGIGLGLSTASMINSAASHDMTGTGLGMASYLKAPTELAATSAGWGWAKWIPGAGVVMDGYSAYHDVSATISDYNACMAHP